MGETQVEEAKTETIDIKTQLKELSKKVGIDFFVTSKSSDGFWKEWLPLSEWLNTKPYLPNYRQILPAELVLETDKETESLNRPIAEQIKQELDARGLGYTCWFSGNKSYHFHLWFEGLEKVAEKIRKEVKEELAYAILPPLLAVEIDKQNFGNKHMIGIENAPHRTTGKLKTLVWEKTGTNKLRNFFSEEEETKLLEWKNKILLSNTPAPDKCVFLDYCLDHELPQGSRNRDIVPNFVAYQKDADKWDKFCVSQKIQMRELENWAKEKPGFGCRQLQKYANENKIFKKTCVSCKQAKETDKTFRKGNFCPYTIGHFLEMKKDKNFFIDGILYPKTTNMLFAPPAQYKSLLALTMGLCVATGKPFLGQKTKKNPVLYCDKENNAQTIKQRIEGLCAGLGIKNKKMPLWFHIRTGDIINDSSFLEDVLSFIEENKIKLIIFDTLHRFGDYDENSANDINRLYNNVFLPLVDEHECSVLFLHHVTKNGEYRGSTDLMGCVDTAFKIDKAKTSTRFRFVNEKGRFGELDSLAGEVTFGETKIEIIQRDADEENIGNAEQFNTCVRFVEELFPTIGTSLKRKEIEKHTVEKDISISTLKRCLEWFIMKKWFTRDKGIYKRISFKNQQKTLEGYKKDDFGEENDAQNGNSEELE